MVTPDREMTFLFTDIEGSTRLWEEQPAAMSGALAHHDEILRVAIEGHGGHVFKTMGDAFCAAFESASVALACAVDIQRALSEQDWPTTTPLRVRMAVHTGAVEQRDGDYFGPTLNRVARLESAAHGGQVVVSEATYTRVAGTPMGDASLRDLGEHVLRDLTRPEPIFQLDIVGLSEDFPPLRTLTSPFLRHNLPLQLTSFIGRTQESGALGVLLERHRLVTIAGPGGTGKTRLSLHVAADLVGRHAGGVWFVELGSLREVEHVAAAVATVLDTGTAGSSLDAVVSTLGDAPTLIILDNCEHLVDAAASLVHELLIRCRGVRVLATSREPLNVEGESVFRLPPMAVPDDVDLVSVRTSDAVRLFEDRAQLQAPGFVVDNDNVAGVAALCRQLDGVALSIELAATKLRTMSLHDIEARLGDHLRLLAGSSRSAAPRQRSLRAMLDWSFELLDDVHRDTLNQLSVFAGDWNIASAESVVTGGSGEDVLDVIAQLVDKSLVQVRPTRDSTRYFLLESVRQYGVANLRDAPGALETVQLRHARHFQRLCAVASLEFHGSEQFRWLADVETEWDNIVRAIEFFDGDDAGAEDVLQTCVYLRTFLLDRFRTDEGASLLAHALAVVTSTASATLVARAWEVAGRCHNQSRRIEASRVALQRGLDFARQSGDPVALGRLALLQAYLAFNEGSHDVAISRAEEAVAYARSAGAAYRSDLVVALRIVGGFRSERGQEFLEQARAESTEALALARELGDVRDEIRLLEDLGLMAIQAGDPARARVDFERVVTLINDDAPGTGRRRRLANVSINLATVALMESDVVALGRYLSDSLSYERHWEELVPYQVLYGALFASRTDERETAVILHGASDALIEHYNMQREAVESSQREADLVRLKSDVDHSRFRELIDHGRSLDQDAALGVVDRLLEARRAG